MCPSAECHRPQRFISLFLLPRIRRCDQVCRGYRAMFSVGSHRSNRRNERLGTRPIVNASQQFDSSGPSQNQAYQRNNQQWTGVLLVSIIPTPQSRSSSISFLAKETNPRHCIFLRIRFLSLRLRANRESDAKGLFYSGFSGRRSGFAQEF